MNSARRQLLVGMSSLGAGAILLGCNRPGKSELNEANSNEDEEEKDIGEVTATEDLMREHGVLRRTLIVYHETALKLRGSSSVVPPEPLQRAAKLFRAFGEEYHEKKLEEAYIFPAVKKGGFAAGYVDTLLAQHQRGREITDYILSTTSGSKLATANVEPFAQALESLVRMYEHHAAIEDTIVFPAWKQTLNGEQLDEMNEKFEDIEQEQFGADGFDNAVKQIADIEQALGLADLAQFTAPPPPGP